MRKKNIVTESLKIVKKYLVELSEHEEVWIYYCLRENKRTIITTSINSAAVSLKGKCILYRPTSTHSTLKTPFTIHNNIWNYLVKNKDNFCSNEKLNDHNSIYIVNKFIKSTSSVIGE